jgi:hypothetical protein
MKLMSGRRERATTGAIVLAALTIGSAGCGRRSTTTGPTESVGGCASNSPQNGPPPAGQADVVVIQGATPPNCEVSCFIGASIPLLAIVKDVNGTILLNQTVNWLSSNTATATVVGRGLTASGYIGGVTCVGPGTSAVSAVDGDLEASVSVESQ